MVPVKPGDKIYCSSFQSQSITGGAQDGICVAYFDKDGKLLRSVSAAEVYAEFTGNDKQYITVPDGAYIMNVPVWNADQKKIIKNLSLGEQRYRPENYNEFQAMGSKILQAQVEKFTEDLVENAKLTGQNHKLAIVTYGGGDVLSDAEKLKDRERGVEAGHQGVYEKYVGVNGWSRYFFTNTGLFVNGTFKNYLNQKVIDSGVNPSNAYHPVFDTAAAPLDQNETYYYMSWGKDSHINSEGVWQGGGMIAVTYNAAEGAWYDAEGNKRVPRESPYDKFGKSLFYTRNAYAAEQANQLTDADYRDALTDILVDGQLNPDIKYATDRYVSRGTTHTKYGLAMANHILKQNPVRSGTDIYGQEHQGKQIVILFTDGETNNPNTVDGKPTYSAIFEQANAIKSRGAILYTVSVGTEANQKWLDQISSNYSAGGKYDDTLALSGKKYCINVNDISELESSFESISSEIDISKTSVELGESAVMQDYLADGLTMPEDFGFDNIKVFTMGIQTDDEITYTTTNKDGNFVLVPDSISQNGDVYTATYNCTYVMPDQTYSKDLYVSYNKVTGCVSVTGFDYALNFVSKDHPGRKLMVTISGIEATKDTKTDQALPTNTRQSGIAYEGTLIPFDVPVTQLNSKNYVADYAKPMVLDPSEWGVEEILGIVSADRLKLGEGAKDLIQTDYGTFQNADGTVTFTPSTMQWDGEAVVYVLGSWEQKPEGISTGDRVWTRVSVVPANNIYYEDDFQDVAYVGNWSVEGTLQTGTLENPIGAAGTTNPVHGWEQSLVDAAHSDGAAHMGIAVAAAEGIERQIAEVSFTFKGAGVDIYGFTSKGTGTVLAMLTGQYEDENGEVRSIKIVDTVSVSGDYYQIPTLSFMEYKGEPLPFGTYTVTIGVTTAAKDRCTYYLDGIRVYNPMENDSVYADAEKNAKFVSVRDLLAATDDVGSSAVFVDKTEAGDVGAAKNYAESDYGLYGPKNEVYLATGQSITFKVDPVGAYYYVGLKCPDGSADGKVKFSNGNVKVQSTYINHSTDLYYAVVPDEYGYITIANSGEALLSVTKLRIAGPAASGQVLTLSEEEALEAVQLFSMRSVEEDVTDPDDSGSNDTGSDDTGSDNTGSDNTGSDNTGSDNTGSDNTGSSNTENNTKPPVKVPADLDNPETADGSISVMIWVMCGALIMAAYLMVSRVRRCGYEA